MAGHKHKEDRDWHKTRVMASILLQPHLKKGKRIKPEDLIQLGGDVKHIMTPEQRKADMDRKMKLVKKRIQ